MGCGPSTVEDKQQSSLPHQLDHKQQNQQQLQAAQRPPEKKREQSIKSSPAKQLFEQDKGAKQMFQLITYQVKVEDKASYSFPMAEDIQKKHSNKQNELFTESILLNMFDKSEILTFLKRTLDIEQVSLELLPYQEKPGEFDFSNYKKDAIKPLVLVFQGPTSKRFAFITMGKYQNKIYFVQLPYHLDEQPMLKIYNQSDFNVGYQGYEILPKIIITDQLISFQYLRKRPMCPEGHQYTYRLNPPKAKKDQKEQKQVQKKENLQNEQSQQIQQQESEHQFFMCTKCNEQTSIEKGMWVCDRHPDEAILICTRCINIDPSMEVCTKEHQLNRQVWKEQKEWKCSSCASYQFEPIYKKCPKCDEMRCEECLNNSFKSEYRILFQIDQKGVLSRDQVHIVYKYRRRDSFVGKDQPAKDNETLMGKTGANVSNIEAYVINVL